MEQGKCHRLRAFGFDVNGSTAMLAVRRVGIVAGKAAVGTSVANLLWTENGLNETQANAHRPDHQYC
jgi:hypothetical protein